MGTCPEAGPRLGGGALRIRSVDRRGSSLTAERRRMGAGVAPLVGAVSQPAHVEVSSCVAASALWIPPCAFSVDTFPPPPRTVDGPSS